MLFQVIKNQKSNFVNMILKTFSINNYVKCKNVWSFIFYDFFFNLFNCIFFSNNSYLKTILPNTICCFFMGEC